MAVRKEEYFKNDIEVLLTEVQARAQELFGPISSRVDGNGCNMYNSMLEPSNFDISIPYLPATNSSHSDIDYDITECVS